MCGIEGAEKLLSAPTPTFDQRLPSFSTLLATENFHSRAGREPARELGVPYAPNSLCIFSLSRALWRRTPLP